ncbi:MAG TPA: hypothetical protein VIS72_00150 [Anaerolineales bacterium]
MLISTYLNGLYEKTLRLGRSRFWLLFPGLVFLVVILINGIGVVPEEPYQRLAENPFITRTDIHFNNYWQENPLLPVIAFYLGLSSPGTFNFLCLAIITGAFLLFALLSSRRWGSAPALIFATLLITSPLTTVLLTWLGTPDGLTVALTVPFLFTGSSLLVFFLSLLGATSHPAFMIAVVEILALRWAARESVKFKHILTTGIGLAAGYGLTRRFLMVNQIEVVSRLDFMLLKDLGEWMKMNALNFPMSIFSLFNIHWLALPLCLVMFFRKDRVFYSLVLVLLLVNYGFTFFTLDTTRIFSLLSWGILFICIFHSYKLSLNEQEIQKQFLQSLILVSIVSFITPRYFSWVGEIHTTPFYQFMRKIFR